MSMLRASWAAAFISPWLGLSVVKEPPLPNADPAAS